MSVQSSNRQYGWDVARQIANVVGAVFQALGGAFFVANLSAEPVADEGASTLIDPAGFAFFVWAPILLLSLAYAIYQALPSRKEDSLLRLVGWPLAGAFVLAGLWEVAAPLGRLGAAQILIVGLLVLLAAAYLRLARAGSRSGTRLSVADHWLIAPTVGIYFAWITAANAVSLTSLAARSGLVDGGGAGGAALGTALLILGTIFACGALLAARTGPRQILVAYAGTVLWALIGIVANQYGASALTTAVAALCAVPVVVVLVGAARAPGAHSIGRGKAPRVS